MSSPFSDTVEDSEPEREALRAEIKEQRRQKRKRPPLDTQQAISIHQSDSEPDNMQGVVELSSDFVEIVHSPTPIAKARTPSGDIQVIEFTRTDEDLPSRILPRKPRIATASLASQSHKLLGNPSTTLIHDENVQESPKASKFQKYAVNSTKSRQNLGRATAAPVTSAEIPRAPRKVSNKFEDDFTTAELGLIRVCPGCDAAWSARKTGVQKLAHIRTCAKKHSLADETVRAIIRRKIREAQGITGEENKAENLKTVYEELVPEQEGFKQRKKARPLETVKNVADARNGIMERARSIIGEVSGEKAVDSHSSIRTQAIAPTSSSTSTMLDQTQAFGKSNLAAQHQRSTTLFQEEEESVEFMPYADEFLDAPATQAFPPSRFGGSEQIKEMTNTNEPSPSSLPIIDLTQPRKKGVSRKKVTQRKLTGLSGGALIPSEPGTSRITPVDDSTRNAENDSAIICFIPEPAPPLVSTPKKKTRIKAPSPSKLRSQSQKTPVKRSRSKGKRRSSEQPEEEADEMDDASFKQMVFARIKADQELYLRILRYEPIHFDVFADLAEIEGTRKGLRQKLRNYLDALGVSFYGADGALGRRGR